MNDARPCGLLALYRHLVAVHIAAGRSGREVFALAQVSEMAHYRWLLRERTSGDALLLEQACEHLAHPLGLSVQIAALNIPTGA